MILEQFGEKVRAQRRAQGLSQKQLAKQLDISRIWLSKIERGRASTLSLCLAQKISHTLGINPPFNGGMEAHCGSIPPSLRMLAEQDHVPEADLEMLARITYRGKQPNDARLWRALYAVVKAVSKDGDDVG